MAESLQKIRVQRASVLEKVPGAYPQFPKSTMHLEPSILGDLELSWKEIKRGAAWVRSFFSSKLQVIGQSFTTSDNESLAQLTEDEERNIEILTRLLIRLKPTIRLYACGNLPVPKLYLVRNSATGESSVINAKLTHLLFDIDEVTTHV